MSEGTKDWADKALDEMRMACTSTDTWPAIMRKHAEAEGVTERKMYAALNYTVEAIRKALDGAFAALEAEGLPAGVQGLRQALAERRTFRAEAEGERKLASTFRQILSEAGVKPTYSGLREMMIAHAVSAESARAAIDQLRWELVKHREASAVCRKALEGVA